MPIHREGSGYQWGNHGKVYKTKAQAEKQAEAAHANGYVGDQDEEAAPVTVLTPAQMTETNRRYWQAPEQVPEKDTEK